MPLLRIALLDSWLQTVAQGSGTAAAIGGLGRALRAQGHHVARVAPTFARPANLTARRLLFNLALPALLRALPYDLIVGFDIDGFLVSGSAPAPYVCSVKGVIAEELRHERGGVRRMLSSLARLERRNARRAPLVLTTSAYCRRQIGAHYGVPAGRCARPRRSPRRAPGAPRPARRLRRIWTGPRCAVRLGQRGRALPGRSGRPAVARLLHRCHRFPAQR